MSNFHNLTTRTLDYSQITSTDATITTGLTCNAIKGRIIRSGISGASATAGTLQNITITNNRVGKDSVIIVNLVAITGPGSALFAVVPASGSFTLAIASSTANAITAFTVDFYVLNPVGSK